MANIKSKIKRMRQSKKAAERNKDVRSSLKTMISSFKESVEKKDKENASKIYKEAIVATDKAASKGVIHSRRAAQNKSLLDRLFNNLK